MPLVVLLPLVGVVFGVSFAEFYKRSAAQNRSEEQVQ